MSARRYQNGIAAWATGTPPLWRIYDANDLFVGVVRKEGPSAWVGYTDNLAMAEGRSWVDGRTLEYAAVVMAGGIPEKRAA
jgi:hypothetical protein